MNELALFAGAGGGILGGLLLGWRTVCAVELDPYARSVLLARQNDGTLSPFPIWDDIRTFDGRPWMGVVDVVSGGFPCQGFSSAARGRLVHPNLWPEMRRIVREVQPNCVFVENVTHARGALEVAARDLQALGYRVRGPFRLGAHEVGAPHLRDRLWVAGYADSDGEPVGSKHGEVAWMPELATLGRRNWPDPPRALRVADGVAHRMDRLATAGNGQVPRVAAAAWRALIQLPSEGQQQP